MITITVNGREEKLNIGCRTFADLAVVLDILEVKRNEVTLNGETIHHQKFAMTTVKGGDTLGVAK